MDNTTERIVPEYKWRGQYVVDMILHGNPHPFALYSQAKRAASVALDFLGRE